MGHFFENYCELPYTSCVKNTFENIVQVRRQAGLTQADVIRKSGLPRRTIQRIENGSTVSHLENLVCYLQACGLKRTDAVQQAEDYRDRVFSRMRPVKATGIGGDVLAASATNADIGKMMVSRSGGIMIVGYFFNPAAVDQNGSIQFWDAFRRTFAIFSDRFVASHGAQSGTDGDDTEIMHAFFTVDDFLRIGFPRSYWISSASRLLKYGLTLATLAGKNTAVLDDFSSLFSERLPLTRMVRNFERQNRNAVAGKSVIDDVVRFVRDEWLGMDKKTQHMVLAYASTLGPRLNDSGEIVTDEFPLDKWLEKKGKYRGVKASVSFKEEWVLSALDVFKKRPTLGRSGTIAVTQTTTPALMEMLASIAEEGTTVVTGIPSTSELNGSLRLLSIQEFRDCFNASQEEAKNSLRGRHTA